MTRPALSATRALDIIDLMSETPGRAYTLSELVRQTGTNVASCHAVLNAMWSRGYVVRHPAHKTYRLSSALIGIGQAVAATDALYGHAKDAAEQLARATGLEAVLTAHVGDSIMCLARSAGSPQVRATMRPGRRAPLRPPLGATFYAWSDAAEVDRWLSYGDPADAASNREALALVRERGFLVTLRSSEQSELRRVLAAASDRPEPRPQDISQALGALQHAPYQPETLEVEQAYDIEFISAPVFDPHDQAIYALTISGFDRPLSGREALGQATRLLGACADAMGESGVSRRRRKG